MAGAFASYYWAFKKPEDIPANPIFASLGRALRSVAGGGIACLWKWGRSAPLLTFAFCFLLRFRYHTGSLAFGSLILSLVQVIRVVLEYLDHKLKGRDTLKKK